MLAGAAPLLGVAVPWAASGDGNGSDWVSGASLMDDGASVTTGTFGSGTLTLGPFALTRAGSGDTDVFITKSKADGTYAWATRGGGTGADEGTAVATRSDGSSIVTGKFTGSADFGTTTLAGGGGPTGWDAFVAKVNADGTYAWAQRAQVGGAGQKAGGRGVTTLADGSAIVVGEFDSTVTLGTTTLTSAGGWDMYIAKVNADGTYGWAIRAGGASGDDGAYGVTALPTGGVLLTGFITGTASVGAQVVTSAGDKDVLVAKVNADGTVAWATRAGGTTADWGMGISALPDGAAVLTGFFTGNDARFGTTALASAGGDDLFVAKVAADGAFAWATRGGGTGTDRGRAVAALADGSATVTGYYTNTGAPSFGSQVLAGGTGENVVVAKIGATGAFTWATDAGAAGTDRGYGISSLPDGSSTVAGFFAQNITFGATTLTATGSANPFIAGYQDAPVAPDAPTAVGGTRQATVTVPAITGPSITRYTVTATPGGATCTITPPSRSCVVTGLAGGTRHTFTAAATNPAGTSVASASSNAVTPRTPCGDSMYQASPRAITYDANRRAYRVVSRLRVYAGPEAACNVAMTAIVRNGTSGRRYTQLRGSRAGTRTLTSRRASALTMPWPTAAQMRLTAGDPSGQARRNAQVNVVTYIARSRANTLAAMRKAQLVLVRRIPRDPLLPASDTNTLVPQESIFVSATGWPRLR